MQDVEDLDRRADYSLVWELDSTVSSVAPSQAPAGFNIVRDARGHIVATPAVTLPSNSEQQPSIQLNRTAKADVTQHPHPSPQNYANNRGIGAAPQQRLRGNAPVFELSCILLDFLKLFTSHGIR